MEYTQEQRSAARAELARRELAKRGQALPPQDEEEDQGAYLDNLPESEGFLHKLPRNIIAGLANLGHSTINLPHDLTQNLEGQAEDLNKSVNKAFPWPKEVQERLSKMPKHEQFKLSEHIPHQQEYDFAQMLGQEGEGTLLDQIIQKGVEYAPEIAGGRALLKGGVKRLKGTHQLDKVSEFIKQKGLDQFNYPPDMIRQAKKFLPNTQATKELLAQVEAGRYDPAFTLQSQIGHHQRQLARSPLASENSIMAPKAGELKQNMLGHLEKILRSAGHDEHADLLRSGINTHRQYRKVMDVLMPVLKKAGIPVTILSALGFGYKKAKKVLSD